MLSRLSRFRTGARPGPRLGWGLASALSALLVLSATARSEDKVLSEAPAPSRQRPPKIDKMVYAEKTPHFQLLFHSDVSVIRFWFDIQIEGEPYYPSWQKLAAKFVAFYDRDGDGQLDASEASRLPTPFSLRQLAWGTVPFYPDELLPFAELDENGDRKVSAEELFQYYRKHDAASPIAGSGRAPNTDALTKAILQALDTNHDDVVDASEWRAAPQSLRPLDGDDNELIGPGELIPNAIYPGASASRLLPPLSRQEHLSDEQLQITWTEDLPDDHRELNETSFPQWVKLSDEPVPGFATIFAFVGARVRFDFANGETPKSYSWSYGENEWQPEGFHCIPDSTMYIELAGDAGKLAGQLSEVRRDLMDQFSEADVDGDNVVVAADASQRKMEKLKSLTQVADRNHDGKLQKQELIDWLALEQEIGKRTVRVGVLDMGTGLFEWLDVNNDGGLSQRELAEAWKRIEKKRLTKERIDGSNRKIVELDLKKLPQQFRVIVSNGLPTSPLVAHQSLSEENGWYKEGMRAKPEVHPLPRWFRAMDQNGDGDVSRREFIGTKEEFQRIDLDNDGLINRAEIER